MKMKYLWPALKFACLPTLYILVLLFFGFFSISGTLAFIASSSGWAITLRVFAVISEIVLVYYMYNKYEEEDIINNPEISEHPKEISSRQSLYDIQNHWSSSDKYFLHKTNSSDIILIERRFKPN